MAENNKPPQGGQAPQAKPATAPTAASKPAQPSSSAPVNPAMAKLAAAAAAAKAAPPTQKTVMGQKVNLSGPRKKVGLSMKDLNQKEAKKEVEKEPETPAEERVFAIEGLKDIPESVIYTQYQEKIGPKLRLADTSWTILEAFSNIDVTAERVSVALKANPYYEYHFMKVLESLSKREEMPSLEGAIVLMGMQNFRNLMIALQMYRCVTGKHAEWDKDGKLKLTPSDLLKYAIKTEDVLLSKKSEYSDTAYVAGLLFDLIILIADANCQDKKKVVGYIDSLYNHGLRTAQIGAELVEHIPDVGFKKYIFAACLVHDIGKACLAILNPDYIPFLEEVRKKELPRPIRHFAEQKRFDVDHAIFGGLVCNAFRIFRPIEKAIQFHHEPYLLHQQNPSLYQLSALVALCTNIANSFKKVDKADDPIIPIWKGYDLKDFTISFRALADTVAKIQI